jgi:bla regulator protein blaR1
MPEKRRSGGWGLVGSRLLTSAVAFVAFFAGVRSPAQAPAATDKVGIAGTWQGTLHTPGGDLRIVLQVGKTPAGALSATMYSLDQGGQPFVANSVSFEGGTLRLAVSMLGLGYEGKISADGNSISGTMTQNGSYPLALERATPETEWAIPAAPRKISAMAADAKPGIEVATVRLSSPDLHKSGMTFRGREIVVYGYTPDDMVKFCYDLGAKQLANEPDWMKSERFDVDVLPDQPGFPSVEQFQIVLKEVLAERFALRFHEEKKEMPVYVLAVAKDGAKMTKSTDPSEPGGMSIGPLGLVRAHNMTMSRFAAKMQAMVLDRPVLDRTGLAGKWDFALQWRVDESQFGGQLKPPAADDPAASLPPLFTAMREQLGLQLESVKTEVDVMVIDRVEQPSAN